jgi:hypothetical protein
MLSRCYPVRVFSPLTSNYEQETTMTTTDHISLPAGATHAGTWEHDGHELRRWVYGTTRSVEGVSVNIGGMQHSDGSVDWTGYLIADPRTNELDAAGLRQLARASHRLRRRARPAVGLRWHGDAMTARAALLGVAIAGAILSVPTAVADPEPTPPTPYQVPTQNGPMLPGNEQLPPICAHAMQSCGFDYDPATGTWRPRVDG